MIGAVTTTGRDDFPVVLDRMRHLVKTEDATRHVSISEYDTHVYLESYHFVIFSGRTCELHTWHRNLMNHRTRRDHHTMDQCSLLARWFNGTYQNGFNLMYQIVHENCIALN